MTDSMQQAIGETERRRAKQIAYNLANGITPRSISKQVKDLIDGVYSDKAQQGDWRSRSAGARGRGHVAKRTLASEIKRLEKQMLEHARNLEFEKAARMRDQLALLQASRRSAPSVHDNVVPIQAGRRHERH